MTASLYCPLCVLPGATVATVAEARHLADLHDNLHHHPLETMTVTVRGRLGRKRVVRGRSDVSTGPPPASVVQQPQPQPKPR